jgi:hypothetical protein
MSNTTRRETRNQWPCLPTTVIYEEGDIRIMAIQSTCWTCPHSKDIAEVRCSYAYDPYNIHGDCLAMK